MSTILPSKAKDPRLPAAASASMAMSLRARDIVSAGTIFLVDDGDLPRMDATSALKSEIARTAHHGTKGFQVTESRHTVHETQWQDPCCTSRNHHVLLGIQQGLTAGHHVAVE